MGEQQCKIIQYGTYSFAYFDDGRIEVLGTNKTLDVKKADTQRQDVENNMEMMISDHGGFVKTLVRKSANL